MKGRHPVMRSPYLPDPDSITPTKDARVRIVGYGGSNWRTEVRDGDGQFDITGPPYATKTEALANVDYALWIGYGVPMPGAAAPLSTSELVSAVARAQVDAPAYGAQWYALGRARTALAEAEAHQRNGG
jgi:hypothetical protein